MDSCVLLETIGPVAHIVLNRPHKLNALTEAMYRRISGLLDEVGDDESIRVVILRGEGRAFSAGFDLHEQMAERTAAQKREILALANGNRWRIWNMTKPVVAQVHGYCLGGAFELVLPCDLVIAAEDAQMGEPEIQFGTGPAFLLVPWLVGLRRAKELLYTGRRISGSEAERIGLINRAVPAADLEVEVDRWVKELLPIPRPALKMVKKGINRAFEFQGLKAAQDYWEEMLQYRSLWESKEQTAFANWVVEYGVKEALARRKALWAKEEKH